MFRARKKTFKDLFNATGGSRCIGLYEAIENKLVEEDIDFGDDIEKWSWSEYLSLWYLSKDGHETDILRWGCGPARWILGFNDYYHVGLENWENISSGLVQK